jgi:hypothetical protein
MMHLGIMSDTHGNRRLMHTVADRLLGELKVESIIHLGDSYADAEELLHAGNPVRMVPGLWCPEYHNSRVRRYLFERVGEVAWAAAHIERDLRSVYNDAAIIMTGHTHVARIEHGGGRIHLNPGHLKGASHRGQAPSYATLRIDTAKVVAILYEADGRVRQQVEVSTDVLL